MSGLAKRTNWSKSAGLLAMSVCLNLLLAAIAILLFAKRAAPTAKPAAGLTSATVRTQLLVATEPPTSINYVTNAFHWRQIESTNYDEYVANLRAVGCPEKTVRDIILADVIKVYASRDKVLLRGQPFWQSGRQRKLADLEREKQHVALRDEQRELIRRLLGMELPEGGLSSGRDLEEQAVSRFLLGPMPEETFHRFLERMEKHDRLLGEFRRRAGGLLTDEDEAGLRALGAQLHQEIASLLTPSQFEECKARIKAFEFFAAHGDWTQAIELTPAEARQIALARTDPGDVFELFRSDIPETAAERTAREVQFTNTVAALLGEKRFADFTRAQDGNFMELFRLARDNELPKESAVKVYDLRQFAADEVRRLRDDPELDAVARRQQFDEMHSALQKSISEVLGAGAYEEYLRSGGSWITNVTGL